MNQKNGKNSLGLDSCFEDLDNPIELFKKWFSKAEESEIMLNRLSRFYLVNLKKFFTLLDLFAHTRL